MVFTHFPCCVAVLGIPRHIVLVPYELEQVLLGSFGCVSHTAGTYVSVAASHYVVSMERLGLIKCRPCQDLGFSQQFWTLLPRHEKHWLLSTHSKATENCNRHRSICLTTSQPFQNYSWNGTILPSTTLNMEWK